ncbi:MAG: PCRF domain-containing protein [Planctomycetota bacterium]
MIESFLGNLPPSVLSTFTDLETQHDLFGEALQDSAILTDHKKVREISMKRAAIEPVVLASRRFKAAAREIEQLESAIKANADPDFVAMAREELPQLRAAAAQALAAAVSTLVTADDRKVGSVIVEVRAGTGGDEAALWARDLVDVYQKNAARRGWSCEVLEHSADAAGGLRSATLNIKGEGVWSEMAFEAGVHSVKRVPATETMGRIHTSTATVAVLPEPEEVDVKIDWANDVEEAATRSQGPGGQNVNKVESAWQIHHKPSGIIIKMMEAKSQQQNRERARRLLMTRLHEFERQRQHADRSAARKVQIRGGERSDKIRTYRWKEGIIADERLPGEYQLRDLLAGDMSKIVKDLLDSETAKRLAEL